MTSLRQTAVNNDFVCGHCPGNDSKCVVVDLLGASILKERLIEHGHDVLLRLL